MNAIVFVCVAVSSLVVSGVKGANPVSPCPHILTYEDQAVNDRWQAVLELKDAGGLEGIWLNVLLDTKADVLINTFGETSSSDNQKFVIHKPDFALPRGTILRIRLIVKYNPDKPVPNVVSIKLNGVEVCSNNVINTPTTATPQIVITTPTTSATPDIIQQSSPSIDIDIRTNDQQDTTCGIKTQARPLVYNGHVAEEHWPWHVAIMKRSNTKFDYHCGGTLISNRYILTAAHCVTKLTTTKIIDNEMFVLYLGLTNLSDLGPAIKLRLVGDITIHKEYNPGRYHNDLAVLKLSEPVEFNDFIRPICLWDGDLEIRNLIGQYGTVVGWGLDNSNKTSPNLMEARLPIVGLETCLYHDRNFFSQFTSPKTYCAGGGNGTAVCSGDSGGGMIFPKPGTSGKDTVWHIRGLVSVSPRDSESICNTKSYAVFTDVAQHLTWIKQVANLK